jgi:hypothetical protein
MLLLIVHLFQGSLWFICPITELGGLLLSSIVWRGAQVDTVVLVISPSFTSNFRVADIRGAFFIFYFFMFLCFYSLKSLNITPLPLCGSSVYISIILDSIWTVQIRLAPIIRPSGQLATKSDTPLRLSLHGMASNNALWRGLDSQSTETAY